MNFPVDEFPELGNLYAEPPPLAYKFRQTGKFKCLQKTPNALENLWITSITIVNMSLKWQGNCPVQMSTGNN
eukprot:1145038-Pelagomonas_calceolata.AAC.7